MIMAQPSWKCRCGNHETVDVPLRMGPGPMKEGGVGRITKHNADGTFNVKYVLGHSEKNVPNHFVTCTETMLKIQRSPQQPVASSDGEKRADRSCEVERIKRPAGATHAPRVDNKENRAVKKIKRITTSSGLAVTTHAPPPLKRGKRTSVAKDFPSSDLPTDSDVHKTHSVVDCSNKNPTIATPSLRAPLAAASPNSEGRALQRIEVLVPEKGAATPLHEKLGGEKCGRVPWAACSPPVAEAVPVESKAPLLDVTADEELGEEEEDVVVVVEAPSVDQERYMAFMQKLQYAFEGQYEEERTIPLAEVPNAVSRPSDNDCFAYEECMAFLRYATEQNRVMLEETTGKVYQV